MYTIYIYIYIYVYVYVYVYVYTYVYIYIAMMRSGSSALRKFSTSRTLGREERGGMRTGYADLDTDTDIDTGI